MAETGAERSPALPVQPLPMSWGRALLEVVPPAALAGAAALPLWLVLLLPPPGLIHESTGIGDRLWLDQMPRTVMGVALLVSPALALLALAAQVLVMSRRMAIADRVAETVRPPQLERARLARSYWVLLYRILFVAQWFVGVLAVACAGTVFMGETWGLGIGAGFAAVFAANMLIMKGITGRWQPRWEERYSAIRSRWPRTSSEPALTILRPEARWLGRFGTLTGALLGLTITGFMASMGASAIAGVLPMDYVGGLRFVDYVVLGALLFTGGCLSACVISAVAETLARDLSRMREHRELVARLEDRSGLGLSGISGNDAKQELLRPPLLRRVGILMALIAGTLLLVGLAADLNVFDSTSAEDMAQFAVLRVLRIPAIVLGISAWLVLAWGLHCVTLQRAALLRASPHLDPIPAFTRKRATDDDDSTHRLARPGDPVDQEESRRRARDAAHAVQDDD